MARARSGAFAKWRGPPCGARRGHGRNRPRWQGRHGSTAMLPLRRTSSCRSLPRAHTKCSAVAAAGRTTTAQEGALDRVQGNGARRACASTAAGAPRHPTSLPARRMQPGAILRVSCKDFTSGECESIVEQVCRLLEDGGSLRCLRREVVPSCPLSAGFPH